MKRNFGFVILLVFLSLLSGCAESRSGDDSRASSDAEIATSVIENARTNPAEYYAPEALAEVPDGVELSVLVHDREIDIDLSSWKIDPDDENKGHISGVETVTDDEGNTTIIDTYYTLVRIDGEWKLRRGGTVYS